MYRKGYVKPDGNGMTGGHWWSRERTGYKCIEFVDIMDKLEDIACHIPSEINIEATFEEGEDESVGLGHYIDFNDKGGIPEDVMEAIEEAPVSNTWKAAMKAVIEAYIEGLEPDDYTLDEYED